MSHPIYNNENPEELLQHITIKTRKGRAIGLDIGSLGGMYRLLDWQESGDEWPGNSYLLENYPENSSAIELLKNFLRHFNAETVRDSVTELYGDGADPFVSRTELNSLLDLTP